MSVKTAANRIASELAKRLKEKGFKKKGGYMLTRKWGDGVALVSCAVRKDAVSGALLGNLVLGIRFEEVEKVLARDRVGPDSPTIAVPIHLLHENRKFVEWNFDEPETVAVLYNELETYGLPFFEKYSNLNEVLLSFQSDDPFGWFTFSPAMRIGTICILLALRGEQERAFALLDKEIDLRRDAGIGKGLFLKKIRDNLSVMYGSGPS